MIMFIVKNLNSLEMYIENKCLVPLNLDYLLK